MNPRRGGHKTPAQGPAGNLAEAVRLLRAARNNPEAFKRILHSWLSQLGVSPPVGVLTPWPGTPGRPRKPENDAIVATWKRLGRPFLTRQYLARVVYGEDAFARADSREKHRLVNQCRRAVERRIPRDQIPRPIKST
jgi:hypothetical protein